MGTDEEGTLARLKAVRKSLVDPTIAAHRGRIVKTTGERKLVEFAPAVDAVRGAVEAQNVGRAEVGIGLAHQDCGKTATIAGLRSANDCFSQSHLTQYATHFEARNGCNALREKSKDGA
jgi:hypothetical protein